MITLADAHLNALEDLDHLVIDEFRKSSWLLDSMPFHDAVNPAGGGTTLSYTYLRTITERPATFRRYNTEYQDAEAKRAKFGVELAPLGGSFRLDRVLANIGPAATNEVTFQMQQVIKSARAFFSDQVINGMRVRTPAEEEGFDGLDFALAGSSTEMGLGTVTDWTGPGLDTAAEQHAALDLLDAFLAKLDDRPSAILGNEATIARVRSLARRSGYYTRSEDAFGKPVETYNGIPFIDLGAKAGSSAPVIPVESRMVAPEGAPSGPTLDGLSDLYAIRLGLDGFHGVSTAGGQLVRQWLPDFNTAGAVKRGEVEMGPIAVALKATRAAAVLRNIKVK
ncbi:major capsid protein [Streptomyces kronopolitis]|uniref:major capsid protein n=1 Tax=Streptomyces kronopolitis TaxID=1612435 RepID=UPI0020BF0FAD|nr:phage capsid protein [Streptomyces kronopolitis]MCL6302829.1 phage capsid protein [Streptomyces kronopolitis]